MPESERVRVALIAGTLGQGGAEKQLVYMARALLGLGCEVRVYSLTQGEFYEDALRSFGVEPRWVGRLSPPPARLVQLTAALLPFRPHIVQSGHAFANLYAALAARPFQAISIGALRNSLMFSEGMGRGWIRRLLRAPHLLVTNSQATYKEIIERDVLEPARVHVIPNAVDLDDFDAMRSDDTLSPPVALFVGRLIPVKRVDRFLTALASARRLCPSLAGLVVGDGPERARAERLARELGLLDGAVRFLGSRSDVPALLRQATMLVFCSDDEGCPNVVLEAMAARVPVITTPAGDAAAVIEDGVSGYIVPFDGVALMAELMARLAGSRSLVQSLGAAGRARICQHHALPALAGNLLAVYRTAAERRDREHLLRVLPSPTGLA